MDHPHVCFSGRYEFDIVTGCSKHEPENPTIELRLLSSEGLSNHDNTGTIEDVS
jgi:hypothetical protein